jgi:PDZ domain-containing protein
MRSFVVLIGATLAVVTLGLVLAPFFTHERKDRPPSGEAMDAGAAESPPREHRSLLDNRPDVVDPSRKAPPEHAARTATRSTEGDRAAGIPSTNNPALDGLAVENLDESALRAMGVTKERSGGVLVKSVDPASSAWEAAIKPGDVITRAQRDLVTSEDSLRRAVGDRDHSVIEFFRDGKPYYVVLHKPFVPAGD